MTCAPILSILTSDRFFFHPRSLLLVHGDHGWGQQKPLNMGVSDIWRGRQRGPAVRSAAGRAPPPAARGPVPALF